jgi:hypothetical protein
MMRNETSIITKTFSKNNDLIKAQFKPCPVVGKHLVDNMPFDSSLLPKSVLPSGDFRLDMRQFNGHNDTIMEVKYFITIKNPFF